jgi:hypothetical protein
MELYERYNCSKEQDLETKIGVLNEIMRKYPKIVDYIYNRVDTCYGPHIVYLVHMRVGGVDMLKIGYTRIQFRVDFLNPDMLVGMQLKSLKSSGRTDCRPKHPLTSRKP